MQRGRLRHRRSTSYRSAFDSRVARSKSHANLSQITPLSPTYLHRRNYPTFVFSCIWDSYMSLYEAYPARPTEQFYRTEWRDFRVKGDVAHTRKKNCRWISIDAANVSPMLLHLSRDILRADGELQEYTAVGIS
ncbi:hypothetical protein T439DRAFT_327411 [Meredithblackwellia eburnea MCA 4105]